jgi:hypothetical protein
MSAAAAPVGRGPSFAQRLFEVIDPALQPSGMLSDLSRIITTYALTLPKWDARCVDLKAGRLALSAEDSAVRQTALPANAFVWVTSDVPLSEFPCAPPNAPANGDVACDGKSPSSSSLRVWSIRIDKGADAICIGIAEETALDLSSGWGSNALCFSTHSSFVFGGTASDMDVALPYHQTDTTGAVYHLTADLTSGHVRVRPVLKSTADPYPFGCAKEMLTAGQTEWTLTRTPLSSAALAKCRPYVAMMLADSACSLLF